MSLCLSCIYFCLSPVNVIELLFLFHNPEESGNFYVHESNREKPNYYFCSCIPNSNSNATSLPDAISPHLTPDVVCGRRVGDAGEGQAELDLGAFASIFSWLHPLRALGENLKPSSSLQRERASRVLAVLLQLLFGGPFPSTVTSLQILVTTLSLCSVLGEMILLTIASPGEGHIPCGSPVVPHLGKTVPLH